MEEIDRLTVDNVQPKQLQAVFRHILHRDNIKGFHPGISNNVHVTDEKVTFLQDALNKLEAEVLRDEDENARNRGLGKIAALSTVIRGVTYQDAFMVHRASFDKNVTNSREAILHVASEAGQAYKRSKTNPDSEEPESALESGSSESNYGFEFTVPEGFESLNNSIVDLYASGKFGDKKDKSVRNYAESLLVLFEEAKSSEPAEKQRDILARTRQTLRTKISHSVYADSLDVEDSMMKEGIDTLRRFIKPKDASLQNPIYMNMAEATKFVLFIHDIDADEDAEVFVKSRIAYALEKLYCEE